MGRSCSSWHTANKFWSGCVSSNDSPTCTSITAVKREAAAACACTHAGRHQRHRFPLSATDSHLAQPETQIRAETIVRIVCANTIVRSNTQTQIGAHAHR